MREYGGVGEMLCNVFDREGRIVDHPLNQRVMSVPLEAVRAAPIRVLAAGGAHKLAAIDGAIKLLEPTTLVTDAGDGAEADGPGIGGAGPLRALLLREAPNGSRAIQAEAPLTSSSISLATSRRASRCGMWPTRGKRWSAMRPLRPSA